MKVNKWVELQKVTKKRELADQRMDDELIHLIGQTADMGEENQTKKKQGRHLKIHSLIELHPTWSKNNCWKWWPCKANSGFPLLSGWSLIKVFKIFRWPGFWPEAFQDLRCQLKFPTAHYCCCPTKEGAGVRKELWFLINLKLRIVACSWMTSSSSSSSSSSSPTSSSASSSASAKVKKERPVFDQPEICCLPRIVHGWLCESTIWWQLLHYRPRMWQTFDLVVDGYDQVLMMVVRISISNADSALWVQHEN